MGRGQCRGERGLGSSGGIWASRGAAAGDGGSPRLWARLGRGRPRVRDTLRGHALPAPGDPPTRVLPPLATPASRSLPAAARDFPSRPLLRSASPPPLVSCWRRWLFAQLEVRGACRLLAGPDCLPSGCGFRSPPLAALPEPLPSSTLHTSATAAPSQPDIPQGWVMAASSTRLKNHLVSLSFPPPLCFPRLLPHIQPSPCF